MNTRKLKSHLILGFTGFMMIGMFQNCAPTKVSFAEEQEKTMASSAVPGETVNESFRVSSTSTTMSTPIDLVWVVDNSGSMAEEAALVRANLGTFTNILMSVVDVRFLLVSQANGGRFDVALPTGLPSAQFRSINTLVNSNDGPQVMLSKVSAFQAANPTFFRATAKKVVVFVTDDNSYGAANTFLPNAKRDLNWETAMISVYAFTGLGSATSPCQWATGTDYSSLAAQTGGHAFNICLTDWSGSFASLTQSVIQIATIGRSFKLKAAVQKVNKVIANGAALSSSSYSIVSGVLIISESVSLMDGNMVSIEYVAK